MTDIAEIKSFAQKLTVAGRLPARSELLADALAELPVKERRKFRRWMRRNKITAEWMAFRAAEIAGCNLNAAAHIVQQMQRIFDLPEIEDALAVAGYEDAVERHHERQRRRTGSASRPDYALPCA